MIARRHHVQGCRHVDGNDGARGNARGHRHLDRIASGRIHHHLSIGGVDGRGHTYLNRHVTGRCAVRTAKRW